IEISGALKAHPRLQVRMGVHSGPVSGVIDVNGNANLAGAGLNLAQRVMACGDAGHILVSKHVAEDLEEYEHWRPLLHDLGTCEVKHGMRVAIANLYSDQVGNPQLPKKFQALKKHSARMRWAAMTAALLALAAIVASIAIFSRYRVRSTLAAPEKSIAVLPFENLSEEKANAYFANAIQNEIAKAIADQLQAKLLPSEKAAIEKRPTSDLVAYDLYTRARELVGNVTDPATTQQKLVAAIALLQEAVARDRQFAVAWCLLSRLHARMYTAGYDHTVERFKQSYAAIEAASRFDPDAGELHLALANYYYESARDYSRALD